MSVQSLRWSFTYATLRDVPEQQGVFTLWDGANVVLIGTTVGTASLREALRQCLGLEHSGVVEATHYTWEATATPRTRAGDLISAHLHRFGELPRYNRLPLAFGLSSRTPKSRPG